MINFEGPKKPEEKIVEPVTKIDNSPQDKERGEDEQPPQHRTQNPDTIEISQKARELLEKSKKESE